MVYDKRLGARISVCACEQCLFDLLRVDDVTCSPPYDRVSKRDDVRDFLCLYQSTIWYVPRRLLIGR